MFIAMVNYRFGIFAILLLETVTYVTANERDKCYDMVEGLLGNQLGTLVPCIKDLGYKTPKERAANYNCIMRCVLEKAGTLTPEGKIDIYRGLGFMLDNIPDEFMDKAGEGIAKCQEHTDLDFNDLNDVGCSKMKPLVACGVDFVLNLCK